MNKIIKDLYFGNFNPSEENYFNDKEYQMLRDKYNGVVKETIQLLEDHNIKNAYIIIDKLLDSRIDVQQFECLYAFQYGIQLGFQLGDVLFKENTSNNN